MNYNNCPFCGMKCNSESLDPLDLRFRLHCEKCGVINVPGSNFECNIERLKEIFNEVRKKYKPNERVVVVEDIKYFAKYKNDKSHVFMDREGIIEGGKSSRRARSSNRAYDPVRKEPDGAVGSVL